jgi:CHASE3 domain sensor protein
MAGLALLILWLVQAQISVEAWVQHTNGVMLKAMDADRQVGAMELYASSYLLTGDETYREQLQTSNEQLSDILNRISALVSDNPLQERRLLELSGLRGKWMATAAQLNASAHGRDASVATFGELHSAAQEIRVVLESMIDTEEELLVKRTARRQHEDQLIFVLVPVMSILLAVVISYEGWRQITRASRQYENALLSAEQASRSKDNFLATVSHELRNPLNTRYCFALICSLPPSLSAKRVGGE